MYQVCFQFSICCYIKFTNVYCFFLFICPTELARLLKVFIQHSLCYFLVFGKSFYQGSTTSNSLLVIQQNMNVKFPFAFFSDNFRHVQKLAVGTLKLTYFNGYCCSKNVLYWVIHLRCSALKYPHATRRTLGGIGALAGQNLTYSNKILLFVFIA